MVKENSDIVQAFPIRANTYNGTANAFTPKGHNIIHAVADGDITFDMGTEGTVTIAVLAGQDLAFGKEVQAITSTAAVWIS